MAFHVAALSSSVHKGELSVAYSFSLFSLIGRGWLPIFGQHRGMDIVGCLSRGVEVQEEDPGVLAARGTGYRLEKGPSESQVFGVDRKPWSYVVASGKYRIYR